MSLMVIIPSGSFFLSQHLTTLIELDKVTEKGMEYALKLSLPAAYASKITNAKQGSKEWIFYAKKLAELDGEYALQLASFYLIEEYYDESIFWYKKAIKLNYPQAIIKLSEVYISLGKLNKAKDLLRPIRHKKEAKNKLLLLAITEGDTQYLTKQLFKDTSSIDDYLLNQISKYQIVDTESINELSSLSNFNNSALTPIVNFNREHNTCENIIQLFATNLANLEQLNMLIKQTAEHPLSKIFCFNTPRYIPISKLNCVSSAFIPKSGERDEPIQCEESMWSNVTPKIEARYIGLMVEEGGANVNKGILYIDKKDTVDVFTHELAHLVGFVDEYELSETHHLCQKKQSDMFSHNIAILPKYYNGTQAEVRAKVLEQIPWADQINKNTPIIQKIRDYWQTGTPKLISVNKPETIGLYPSDTCNKETIGSFKPIKEISQLNYYEENFPNFYTQRVNKAPHLFSMPSYHYNIAKALFKLGDEEKGLYWLTHALEQERKGTKRYNKIRRGEY